MQESDLAQTQRTPGTAIADNPIGGAATSVSAAGLPMLTVSKRGSWFQSPHVCIPANWEKGSLVVLIEIEAWNRLLRSSGGDVAVAKKAALRHAEHGGSWVPDFGEPAVFINR